MSGTSPACSRALRALRAARAASASTSGGAGPSAGALDPSPKTIHHARRLFSAEGSGGYGKPPDVARLRANQPHPAFPTEPTWSTRELLFPSSDPGGKAGGPAAEDGGDEEEDVIGSEALASLARRAHLPPPAGAAAADAARGVNEILRFVRALDTVEGVDHLEPMWTTIGEDHEYDAREDLPRIVNTDADDAAAKSGLAAMKRERLLSVAPERTRRRAPHFVAAVGMAEAGKAERDEETSSL
jgi:hypothetical protein